MAEETKQERLKRLRDENKKIREEQKALREELEAGKEDRKEARKAQAQARKDVRKYKAEVRELSAKIYGVFSDGDAEAVGELADNLTEAGTGLAKAVREFADAQSQLEEL